MHNFFATVERELYYNLIKQQTDGVLILSSDKIRPRRYFLCYWLADSVGSFHIR